MWRNASQLFTLLTLLKLFTLVEEYRKCTNCIFPWILVKLFSHGAFNTYEYAQCYRYKFWINANDGVLPLLQLLTIDVFIFLFFFLSSGIDSGSNSLSDLSLSLAVLSAMWSTCIPYLSPELTHAHSRTHTHTHTHKRKHLYACVITICLAFPKILSGITLYSKNHIRPWRSLTHLEQICCIWIISVMLIFPGCQLK